MYTKGYYEGTKTNHISKKEFKKLIKESGNKDLGKICKGHDYMISVQNEKINALNKRFDDSFVLGGIIITLLGVILAGVYIKTEHDVKKHMDDNFESRQIEIENLVAESARLVEEIRVQHTLAHNSGTAQTSNSGNRQGESADE